MQKHSKQPVILDSHVIEIAEKHLSSVDPILGEIIKNHRPCTICEKERDSFEQLCLSIIGQQLSVKAARAIRERIRNQIEFFTYESVLRADEEALKANGLSRAKIKYIKALSAMVKNDGINLCSLINMPPDQVIESLTRIPGVGKWTAEMFLIFNLNHADILSVGDAGLQRAVKKIYGEKYNLIEVGKKWSPYTSVASWYLWRYLDANII